MASGLTMVAVDGVDGAGKTMFADALAQRLEADGVAVVRTGIDSFHNPRAVRYSRGKDSPEGFFRDSYNLEALREAAALSGAGRHAVSDRDVRPPRPTGRSPPIRSPFRFLPY